MSQDDNKIIILPPTNERLGSCPNCGKPIWESDFVYYTDKLGEAYRCIECKFIVTREAIIPF